MAFGKTTWVPNALPAVTGAQLNRLEQGIDDLYNKVAFKVYRNAAFSVSDGTQLQFDAVDYDPDGLWQTTGGVDAFSFVAPRAGLWEFTAQYIMSGSPGSLDMGYAVRFWKNYNSVGNRYYEGPRWPNRGSMGISVSSTVHIPVAAGDKIQVRTWMTVAIAAAAIQVGDQSNGMSTWLAGHQVRAT